MDRICSNGGVRSHRCGGCHLLLWWAEKRRSTTWWRGRSKTEPMLQRMDTTGTLSFDIFHREYMRTQERQEKRLDDLDKRVRDLERN